MVHVTYFEILIYITICSVSFFPSGAKVQKTSESSDIGNKKEEDVDDEQKEEEDQETEGKKYCMLTWYSRLS